jgi:hypothetical protein
MALSIPGGFLESTREVRIKSIYFGENDRAVTLHYEVKHDDGTTISCWGAHILGVSDKEEYSDLSLNEWLLRPVRLQAVRSNTHELSIAITKVQIASHWVGTYQTVADPLQTA